MLLTFYQTASFWNAWSSSNVHAHRPPPAGHTWSRHRIQKLLTFSCRFDEDGCWRFIGNKRSPNPLLAGYLWRIVVEVVIEWVSPAWERCSKVDGSNKKFVWFRFVLKKGNNVKFCNIFMISWIELNWIVLRPTDTVTSLKTDYIYFIWFNISFREWEKKKPGSTALIHGTAMSLSDGRRYENVSCLRRLQQKATASGRTYMTSKHGITMYKW